MPRPPAEGTKGPLEGVEKVDNLVANEPEQKDQDQRREIDPADQGYDRRIGRSTGSVRA